MLVLVLAESALETVPKDLWDHSAVKKHSRRRKKHPSVTILDRSYHHAAMRMLNESQRRGRPDIIHFSLLEALGSPLNKEGLLEVYIHTINDYVISVSPETRLPRNYERFVGLMEGLFEVGTAPQTGQVLLRLERKNMRQLINEINPTRVIAFSRIGSPMALRDIIAKFSAERRLTAIVGGFPKGHFSHATASLADNVFSIDYEMLETWTVTSRIIYEYERTISLDKKRLKHPF